MPEVDQPDRLPSERDAGRALEVGHGEGGGRERLELPEIKAGAGGPRDRLRASRPLELLDRRPGLAGVADRLRAQGATWILRSRVKLLVRGGRGPRGLLERVRELHVAVAGEARLGVDPD